jgi:hypothetical protein
MPRCQPSPYGCGRVRSGVKPATGLCWSCTNQVARARDNAAEHSSCTNSRCYLLIDEFDNVNPDCPLHRFAGEPAAYSEDEFVRDADDARRRRPSSPLLAQMERVLGIGSHTLDLNGLNEAWEILQGRAATLLLGLESADAATGVRPAGSAGIQAVRGSDENRQRVDEGE